MKLLTRKLVICVKYQISSLRNKKKMQFLLQNNARVKWDFQRYVGYECSLDSHTEQCLLQVLTRMT